MTFIPKMLAILFAFQLLVGCQVNNSQTASKENQSHQPNQLSIDSKSSNSEPKHGILAAPVFDETLIELARREMRLTPQITDTFQRGGRYFIPAFINDTTFAVACLRGVDIFNIPDTHPDTAGPVPITPIQRIDTPGHAWSITPVVNMIWIADGIAGVQVADPRTGEITATFPEITNARAFHSMGDHDFIICRHSDGADVISSSSGQRIDAIQHLDVDARVFSATNHESSIYLGTLGGGYMEYTLNSSGKYQKKWTFSDCSRILWCHTDGKYHYLLDRDVGLRVLKNTDDGTPQHVSSLKRSGQWRHGCMQNETTLLVAHQDGLLTIDLTNPEAPQLADFMKSPMDSRGVAMANQNIVITDSEFGLRVLDSHGAKHVEVARFGHNGLTADLVLQKAALAVAQTGRGTWVFDNPAEDMDSGKRWIHGQYQTAVSSGGIDSSLLVIADYEGVIILDNSPGKPLHQMGRIRTPGRAVNVAFHNELLMVTDWFEGLQIYDLSDPVHPVHLSTVPTTGWAIDVAARENVAYACCVNQGILTVDISDPKAPVVTHVDTTAQAPEGIAMGKGCIYLADFNFGLLVFDTTNPLKPVPVSCWRHSVCKGVQVRDDILLLCHYIYGLNWFDISDPLKPVMIGELDTWGKAYEAVFIPGEDAVYVADWHDLLKVTW